VLLVVPLLALLARPAATQPASSSDSDTEDGSYTQDIPQIAFLITRPSGRVCRPADQEEIRGRLTSFGNEYKGVEPYSAFVQPIFNAQVGWVRDLAAVAITAHSPPAAARACCWTSFVQQRLAPGTG
jgi:hypothetical protein